MLQEMAVTAQSKSTGRGGVARAGRGASLVPVKRRLQHTISIAVLIVAASGVVQISAAAASQELNSIDQVQRWLVELGVDQSVRDNFKQNDVDVKTLTLSTRDDLKRWGLTSEGKQIKLLAEAKQEQEVKKQHGVASIRTKTYGDSTNKGGIQFCTKSDSNNEVGVKAVLSADGNFGIGVEGEPQARLHVAGDAIFENGHCKNVSAYYINASVDVMVQERSVRGDLEQLRKANATVSRRLEEEVGAVNSTFSKLLVAEIATKDRQIASLRAVLDEHVGNLSSSLMELRAEMVKKDKQIADLAAGMEDFRRNTTKDIQGLKACVCVRKPWPLFSLSSQEVLYPTSYTYPAAYGTQFLIPVGYIPSTNAFDVIDISYRSSISSKYLGGVLAPNGHIYMVPYKAHSIGDMTLSNTEPSYHVGGGLPQAWSSLLSPHFNKL